MCRHCYGQGRINTTTCRSCHSKGTTLHTQSVSTKLSSVSVSVSVAMVTGSYAYNHYLQNRFDDKV